jgi:hypothetical protein
LTLREENFFNTREFVFETLQEFGGACVLIRSELLECTCD